MARDHRQGLDRVQIGLALLSLGGLALILMTSGTAVSNGAPESLGACLAPESAAQIVIDEFQAGAVLGEGGGLSGFDSATVDDCEHACRRVRRLCADVVKAQAHCLQRVYRAQAAAERILDCEGLLTDAAREDCEELAAAGRDLRGAYIHAARKAGVARCDGYAELVCRFTCLSKRQ